MNQFISGFDFEDCLIKHFIIRIHHDGPDSIIKIISKIEIVSVIVITSADEKGKVKVSYADEIDSKINQRYFQVPQKNLFQNYNDAVECIAIIWYKNSHQKKYIHEVTQGLLTEESYQKHISYLIENFPEKLI